MALAIVAGIGLVSASMVLSRIPNLVGAPRAFLALFGAAFACYVAGLWAFAGDRGRRSSLGLLFGVALAARLALLPAPPTLSTDAYRYVWDARVATAGLDPYAYPPVAPELAALRDDRIFPRLNHPTWRTIYPPGAQAFFRTVYAVAPDSVPAMKIAIGLGELSALGLVVMLLARLGLPPTRAAVYAWNPLVLVEVWGTGHLDGLVLPAVVGAVLAAVAGRPGLLAVLLAAGTLVKLYPAVLVPMFLGIATGQGPNPRRAAVLALAVFVGIVLAGYASFAGVGGDVLGSLPRYLHEEYFNPGLVRTLVDHPTLTLVVVLAWIGWATWGRAHDPLGERARRLIGGVTVLGPNVFPWYAIWLAPFLALAPSVAWIVFTGTVALAYTFFLATPWAIPTWARVVEFAPVVLGGAVALGRAWGARRRAGAAGVKGVFETPS